MNLSTDTKLFLGIGIVTLLMIVVASIFLTRPKEAPKLSGEKVDSSRLERADSYSQSTASAKFALVEFADFQCPSCATADPMIKKLLSDNPGKVNYVFRNFPLPQHKNAVLAAIASEAAGDQDKFWEMHSMLFENQSEWSDLKDPSSAFLAYAKELELDVDSFKTALKNNSFKSKINRDTSDGKSLGVSSTPTFFLNGERMSSFADIESIISTGSE